MWLKLCIIAVLFLGRHCDYLDEPFDYYDEDATEDNRTHVLSAVNELDGINFTDYYIFEDDTTDGDTNLSSTNTEVDQGKNKYEDSGTEDKTASKLHLTTYVPPKIEKNNRKLVPYNITAKNISLDEDASLKPSNISIKHNDLKEVDNLTSTTISIVPRIRSDVNTTKDKGIVEATTSAIFNSFNTSNNTSIITTTEIVTTASKTIPVITIPVVVNTTTSTTDPVPPENTNNDNETGVIFKSFNLNYLYFLLLLIPIGGIGIAVLYFSKRRKKDGYAEPIPNANKTRRFSTPSWVFSEPDFDDEEVITLQEEKK